MTLPSLQGSLRTGGVFRGISDYISDHESVEWFQFENVTALAHKAIDKTTKKEVGPSNLSAAVHVLEKEASMFCHVWQVDSQSFGSGQQRTRLWASCFRENLVHMSSSQAHKMLNETMDWLSDVEPCNPEQYLLSSDLSSLSQHTKSIALSSFCVDDFIGGKSGGLNIPALFATGGVVPTNTGSKKRKLTKANSDPSPIGAKWVENHAAAFRAMGEDSLPHYFLVKVSRFLSMRYFATFQAFLIQSEICFMNVPSVSMQPHEKNQERSRFQKPSDTLVSTYPALRTLTRRQLEVLHLKGISLPDNQFRVVDLSQNLGFATATAGKVPCIAPAGEKFLTKECRFLTGVESLRLQGIWYNDEKLGRYSPGFLQDLAGNAFESSSCAANYLCSILFLAANRMCEKVQSMSLEANIPTPESQSDLEQESDLDADASSVSHCQASSFADQMFQQICGDV